MKLTRLKIHGFKSFFDAADVPIESGVTGIVGPNGCGKSNLVDALRFVMGESSYKAMRGGGMDDVIFSGSGKRPPRNIAEVTLLAERETPGAGGWESLEITRRIERDTGSTYRVNGRETRARDVQLLFADAATGAHSSALVRQGQVAELIAAKPVQRRGIVEDAAGIAGLHSRRGEAESRLKAAEANFERLDDVAGEIATQLEALRRQARQAVRYRTLSRDIRQVEAAIFARQWDAAVRRCAEAEAALAAAGLAFSLAAVEQVESAKVEAISAAALPALRDAAAAALAALQRARFAAGELDREAAALASRRDDLANRHRQAAADLAHQGEIGADAAAADKRLTAQAAAGVSQGEGAAERIAAAYALAEQAAAEAAATEAAYGVAAAAFSAAAGERGTCERAVGDAEAKLRRLVAERHAAGAQRDRIRAEAADAGAMAGRAAAQLATERELARLESEAKLAETALQRAGEMENRARAPSDSAELALSALQAEARTLSRLLDPEKSARFPPLLDALEAASGYETALVAALGDDLDASLDVEAPVHWAASAAQAADPPLPNGAQPLADYVTGPPQLTRRLRQVGIVDQACGAECAASLAVGQRLVTRQGALWRWDGLRSRAGAESAGARRLEQRNRLAALPADIAAAQAAARAAAELLNSARTMRADAERLDAANRNAMRAARASLDNHRAAQSEAERRQSRVDERLSAFAGAMARIDAETEATEAEMSAARLALAAMPDGADLAGGRDALKVQLAAQRVTASQLEREAEKLAQEEATRQSRVAEFAAERERWAVRISRAAERVAQLTDRLAALDRDVAALADDPDALAHRRQALLGAIGAAETASAAAADRLAQAESASRQAAHAARAGLDSLSRSREAKAREEERSIAANMRREELAAQIRDQFGCFPGELAVVADLKDAGAAAIEALESRLARLKAERDRLGGVNLRAEEEADEIDKRLDVMRAERSDLEEAIKRLRQAIHSLNREGRERLLAAFAEVNAHFSSLFQHLFGGGAAELMLTGSDDPLEAGLEIVARPPGKRPQTMTLLSGGEQTLTALSLIFAVFLTNPSPLCVLDEVDAPLDDANVERFCALLEDMRRRTDTRFLVVTHNPITMARMDRLFGVTMGERGVSQVVSVDLAGAEGFREAS